MVVDSGHPADRAAGVVEDAIGDVRRNAKTRHSGRRCASEIMMPPISCPHVLRNVVLRIGKLRHGNVALEREHKIRSSQFRLEAMEAVDDLDRLIAQSDVVGFAVFRAARLITGDCRRQVPNRVVEIKLAPPHPGNFIQPLGG